MVEGNWVCRNCWHPNRPSDRKCYRCHAPRIDPESAAASAGEPTPSRPRVEPRLDTDLPFLTFLAVVPMYLYGIFAVGLGILVVIVGLLGAGAGTLGVAGIPAGIVVVIAIGIITSLVGLFQIFLANRVGRHARWAYVVAFLLFISSSVPRLVGGVKPEFTSDAVSIAWSISAWVTFGTAVCVGALLLTSFVGGSAE